VHARVEGPPRLVTVSIDDGSKQDLRLAELLAKHGLRATFYLPARGPLELTPDEIRTLDQAFELGSHSFSHVALTGLSSDSATSEIRDGKAWLEGVLGHQVNAFAYPFGEFNSVIAKLVEQEGFAFARTCLLNRIDFPDDPYRLGMTTDACWHPWRAQIRHGVRGGNLRGLRDYVLVFRLARDWEAHFRRAAGTVGDRGGIAHLVLHSAEIDRRDEWEKLDRVLAMASAAGLQPVTNGESVLRTP